MGEDGRLPLQRNPIQQGNGLGVFVVIPSNLLTVGLDQELSQIKISRQQTKLLHRHLGASEALRVLLFRQLAAGERFNFSWPHQPALHEGMFGKAGVDRRKSNHLVHGLKELFGVFRGHLHLARGIFSHLAHQIAQALILVLCTRGIKIAVQGCGSDRLLAERGSTQQTEGQQNAGAAG